MIDFPLRFQKIQKEQDITVHRTPQMEKELQGAVRAVEDTATLHMKEKEDTTVIGDIMIEDAATSHIQTEDTVILPIEE